MKTKIKLGSVILMSIFSLFSCAPEEQSTPSIVGTWEFSKVGTLDSAGAVVTSNDYAINCATNKDSWTIGATNLTWKEVYDCNGYDLSQYDYTLTDKTLILVPQVDGTLSAPVGSSYEVLLLTQTTLRVKRPTDSKYKASGSSASFFEFVRK